MTCSPIINRTYVIMLQHYGMASAIVDAFDDELHQVVDGKKPEAVKIVHDIMDGKSVDIPSMPKDLQNSPKPPGSSWARCCSRIPGWKSKNHSQLILGCATPAPWPRT